MTIGDVIYVLYLSTNEPLFFIEFSDLNLSDLIHFSPHLVDLLRLHNMSLLLHFIKSSLVPRHP